MLALAAGYESEIVVDELRSPKGLDATLARPSVYVRGPLSGFTSGPAMAAAVAASTRDSFLWCLLDPPPSRSEKVVLSKVRAAYGGAASGTDHAHRLHDVEEGLKQISSPWEERVRNAPDLRDLDRLRVQFAKVPVEETKRAARAELLIVAMDEPDEAGPADLDGERAHQVRVAVVDLRADKVLLRTRQRVDPNWLAANTRSTLASAVDGCALAFDLRAGIGR